MRLSKNLKKQMGRILLVAGKKMRQEMPTEATAAARESH